MVWLSATATVSVFGEYFFGNFRDKAGIIIGGMQYLVGFSVIQNA